jgi:endonuclease YncB( thermonuclease family)
MKFNGWYLLFLFNGDTNKIDYFSFQGKTFYAKPCKVYDGDTFTSVFWYKDEWIKWRCRSFGYDSPEMKPRLSDPDRNITIASAIRARDRFSELLFKTNNISIYCHEFDKYGRILVTIHNGIDTPSINQIMLDEGFGEHYPRRP